MKFIIINLCIYQILIFLALNDGCLRNISMHIQSSHMPPSDTLLHTGDLLTALYYVVKGSLEVVTQDDVILGVLHPGDFFGGLPALATIQNGANNPTLTEFDPCQHRSSFFSNSNLFGKDSESLGLAKNRNSVSQPNPVPKSRFAVRALTYADVQYIDRNDLIELCSIYPELSLRILDEFELTFPLTMSNYCQKTNVSLVFGFMRK